MRRALGLGNSTDPRPHTVPTPAPHGSAVRPQRHFVRDGEVPVTVIHRDESSGTNQLEAARQTIRSLTAAKETAERRLAETQATVQQLQTQLAHERLAREDSVARTEIVRQTLEAVQAELAAEQAARAQAEKRVAEAVRAQPDADHERASCAQAVQGDSEPRRRGRPRKTMTNIELAEAPALAEAMVTDEPTELRSEPIVRPSKRRTVERSDAAREAKSARGERQPATTEPDSNSEFVEWWKPGWREKYRK